MNATASAKATAVRRSFSEGGWTFLPHPQRIDRFHALPDPKERQHNRDWRGLQRVHCATVGVTHVAPGLIAHMCVLRLQPEFCSRVEASS